MADAKKLLILGGTAEARELARHAVEAFAGRADVVTSLAGRTQGPAAVAGSVRTGGFGGSEGLASYLRDESVACVVDATHPFSAEITAHAHAACLREEVPRLLLERPPWQLPAGGRWVEVADLAEAAATVARLGRRVFLTVGRRVEAFAEVPDTWFLVRLIEPPAEPLPLPDHQVIVGRPPFDLAAEKAILEEHRIDCLVSKLSGGDATRAKIVAAHEAAIPTLLVARPFLPPGDAVATVHEAIEWLELRL
jgi:precorrin-6A/cobalt-precorrin-6A reductase